MVESIESPSTVCHPPPRPHVKKLHLMFQPNGHGEAHPNSMTPRARMA